MPPRDPYVVLGVDPDASQATIKAAWRRLAREHHPDLATDDASRRRADRQMAEINAAYEAVREPGRRRKAGTSNGTGAGPDGAGESGDLRRRRHAGPPPPPPTRPVTGRVDTSSTFRPRNSTLGRSAVPPGHQPYRPARTVPEPPRASDPTGPLERARLRRHRRRPDPALETALAHVVEFGKFRGHTLGEIGAFEPSYVDWLARTITRDPELVAAARVVQDDLDQRGVPRRVRTPLREASR
ncbi:MAG TPA: J domain-containing protein [Candidatus Dormibacteraeota bacterium]|nr:J domain-containing protein [Candidatus Dormibacteraeota bacterium]